MRRTCAAAVLALLCGTHSPSLGASCLVSASAARDRRPPPPPLRALALPAARRAPAAASNADTLACSLVALQHGALLRTSDYSPSPRTAHPTAPRRCSATTTRAARSASRIGGAAGARPMGGAGRGASAVPRPARASSGPSASAPPCRARPTTIATAALPTRTAAGSWASACARRRQARSSRVNGVFLTRMPRAPTQTWSAPLCREAYARSTRSDLHRSILCPSRLSVRPMASRLSPHFYQTLQSRHRACTASRPRMARTGAGPSRPFPVSAVACALLPRWLGAGGHVGNGSRGRATAVSQPCVELCALMPCWRRGTQAPSSPRSQRFTLVANRACGPTLSVAPFSSA